VTSKTERLPASEAPPLECPAGDDVRRLFFLDAGHVVAATSRRRAFLWQVAEQQRHVLAAVDLLAVTPGATLLDFDGQSVVERALDGTELGSTRVFEKPTSVDGAALSADGSRLAVHGERRPAVAIVDVATHTATSFSIPQGEDGHEPAGAAHVAWFPDGRRLAVLDTSGAIHVVDAGTLAVERSIPREQSLSVVGFGLSGSSVSEMYVVGSTGQILHEGATTVARLAPTTIASFSAGKVALAGSDRTIRVWDMIDGRVVGSFEGSPGRILAVALDPTASAVAAADEGGGVRLWSLPASGEA
jgi:WD40 repeat protein